MMRPSSGNFYDILESVSRPILFCSPSDFIQYCYLQEGRRGNPVAFKKATCFNHCLMLRGRLLNSLVLDNTHIDGLTGFFFSK